MNFSSKLDIKRTLILSGLIHLFLISPASKTLFNVSLTPEPKIDLPEIEFEFFQAAPREEKQLFIPKKFQEALPPAVKEPAPLPEPPPNLKEEALNDDPTPSEELPPSLEEQAPVKPVEEKTSDSLENEVELQKREEDKKMAWDYCNRVRTLVENNIQFPANLKNQGIQDGVEVIIVLNREGKLMPGTPKIAEGCASRYPEINTQALEGVTRASAFFPPIPKRYSKNEITFSLPVHFDGSTPEQKTEPVSASLKPS